MPMHVEAEIKLCLCCALLVANGDESSCLDYWGHEQHAMSDPTYPDSVMSYVVGEEFEFSGYFVCDGCQSENCGSGFTGSVLAPDA